MAYNPRPDVMHRQPNVPENRPEVSRGREYVRLVGTGVCGECKQPAIWASFRRGKDGHSYGHRRSCFNHKYPRCGNCGSRESCVCRGD